MINLLILKKITEVNLFVNHLLQVLKNQIINILNNRKMKTINFKFQIHNTKINAVEALEEQIKILINKQLKHLG
jgi:hypothetical protein